MSSSTGFIHSVKVPKIYKTSSKIVQTVLEEGGSLKQLLYTTVKANLKGAYALIAKTIQNNALLEKIIESTKLLEENPQLNVYLAKTLITELLLGKGSLQGKSKPIETVLKYGEALGREYERHQAEEPDKAVALPGATISLFLGCTFAMFTLPFLAFFGTRDILVNEFGIIGFASTSWAVIAAVIVVNVIILVYAKKAYSEEARDEITAREEEDAVLGDRKND